MRVLIVEDDAQMGRMLEKGLQEEGFGVGLVRSGGEAVAAALTDPYDVISLDLMIPELDGLHVCAELRRHSVPTPVLMLTALDDVRDRVKGLEAGADDYLAKPFAFEEYVARLRALTRRHLAARAAVLELGEIALDTRGRQASAGGRSLELTAKEFGILEYFMHNPNRYLTRHQIALHVWGYDLPPESNLVEVYVARLRRKLQSAGLADPISTQRHSGYRFNEPRWRDSSAEPGSV